METYQILLEDKDSQSVHEERRNIQLEWDKRYSDEKDLNMLGVLSHDTRGSLVSMSATLKPFSRISIGKLSKEG